MKKIISIIGIVLAMLFFAPPSQHQIIKQGFSSSTSAVRIMNCPGMVGTGVVVGQNKIITASHVVHGGEKCRVTLDVYGRHGVSATVIHDDPLNDFAILETKTNLGNPYSISCDGFQEGQEYTVFGFEFGRRFMAGDATAKGVYRVVSPTGETMLRSLSGHTEEGMSGGPLLDISGSVVGIVIGKLKNGPPVILSRDLSDTPLCQ